MSGMIERVAKALARSDCATWEAKSEAETPCGNAPEQMRDGYRNMARAAIEAMREPTRDMESVGSDVNLADFDEPGQLVGIHAISVWQLMIDEALK